MHIENVGNNLFTPKSAVSYLRVSTRGQAERGGGADEGFSIPAQREANKKKAASMGAVVVKEFVDRGSSAKSVDRKDLQAMLQYIKETPPDYVIVHKVDRLARNRGDDVDIMRVLNEHNVKLISASESIDETPSGMLLHGIMSSIAEFYSHNLATEVKKGMKEKVKAGGSVGKAPVGYLNQRRVDERGREDRYVAVDEERAPLIREAFQLYATGEWVVASLAEHLAGRGLTTRATPEIPSKPIDQKALNKVLINPFYKGIVSFKGKEYEGRHEALTDEQTWQKVQDVLLSHVNGERTRKHPHYLKSVVYCGSCGERLIIQFSKSKSGNYYKYFTCAGRHGKRNNCTQKSVLVEDVEEKVTELMNTVSFESDSRCLIENRLLEGIRKITDEFATEKREMELEKTRCERKQRKLLEAHYADAIPLELFKEEQRSLAEAISDINRRIEIHTEDCNDSEKRLKSALEILEKCGEYYSGAPDRMKKALCRKLFKRIQVHISEDGNARVVPTFTGFYNLLSTHPHDMENETEEIRDERSGLQQFVVAANPPSSIQNYWKHLITCFFGRCFSKALMVDLAGIEPASRKPSHVLLLS